MHTRISVCILGLTEIIVSEAAVTVERAVLGKATPRKADAQCRLFVHWEPSGAVKSYGLGLMPTHEIIILAYFLRQIAVPGILLK